MFSAKHFDPRETGSAYLGVCSDVRSSKSFEMSNVTLEQGDEISKQMAEIFNELITVRCKDETIEAFKYEGQATFEESFQVLGEVAMTELMTNNKVNSYMEGFTKYLDTEALENLFD